MYYILFFYNLITNFRLAIRDITLIFCKYVYISKYRCYQEERLHLLSLQIALYF